MRRFQFLKTGLAFALVVMMMSAVAAAQRDRGEFRIVSAKYGTARRNVDVTARLRDLARQDLTFRMGNSTFGVDPDPGVVKTLRIFARGPNGGVRMFEYREGSIVDGSIFSGWRGGGWGGERWEGGWEGEVRPGPGRPDWGNNPGRPGWGNNPGGPADVGTFRIVSALYGTPRRNVDVTPRLRELARRDVRFRMGNSTFGVDPDPGRVKTLRIISRGPRGEIRTFDYREGSVVDGAQFIGWGRGEWGNERWSGGWDAR